MRAPLLALLTAACARPDGGPRPTPPPASAALQFHVSGQVSGSSESPALPPVALDLDLTLSAGEVRRFRDGSVGQLVIVEQATATEVKQNDQVKDIQVQIFDNKSFELRAFDDGEIVAVGLADHLLGGGLGLDVLDPILALLSPGPPRVDERAPSPGELLWPLRVGAQRWWLNRVMATWSNAGVEDRAGGRGWHLTWTGPWVAEGQDRQASPPLRAEARGEASGEVWMHTEDHQPLQARFEGRRQVSLSTGLAQEQRYALQLERIGPSPLPWPDAREVPEGAPLPRYLDEAHAREVVLGALPTFQACLGASGLPDAEAALTLTLRPDGSVAEAALTGEPLGETARACLLANARALHFGAHDGASASLRWPVVVREGQLAAHPGVQLSERHDVPMFLLVEPSLGSEQRAALEGGLGYAGAPP